MDTLASCVLSRILGVDPQKGARIQKPLLTIQNWSEMLSHYHWPAVHSPLIFVVA